MSTIRVGVDLTDEELQALAAAARANHRDIRGQAAHILSEAVKSLVPKESPMDWDREIKRFDAAREAFMALYGTGLAQQYWGPMRRRYEAGDRSDNLYKMMQEMR